MRRTISLLLALVLALSLASCGSGDPAPSDDLSGTLVASVEPSAEPSHQIVVPDRPASVEAFGVAYSSTTTLNPITAVSRLNLELAPLMYEGLYEIKPDFTAEAVLAESAVRDGLVWTIKLKRGVTMSDGEPLTATDVVYSLELARGSERYAARLAPIVSAMVIDERTVSIATSTEIGRLELLLDVPMIRAGSADEFAPAGSGLYTYFATEEGSYLRVSDARRGEVEITRIELVDTPEAELMISSFEQGTVSIASSDPTATDRIDYGGDYEEWSYATANLLYLSFSSTLDAPLRAILAESIERADIADVDLEGAADAVRYPISPATELGAEQDLDWSPADSRASLEALGAERDDEGFLAIGGKRITVRLLVAEENSYKNAAALRIAEGWRQLGIDVQLTQLGYTDYLAALRRGDFDAALCETQLTADFALDALVGTDGSLNFGAHSDEVLDALLLAYRAANADGIERAADDLYDYLRDNAPIAAIAFERHALLAKRGAVSAADPAPHDLYHGIETWEH